MRLKSQKSNSYEILFSLLFDNMNHKVVGGALTRGHLLKMKPPFLRQQNTTENKKKTEFFQLLSLTLFDPDFKLYLHCASDTVPVKLLTKFQRPRRQENQPVQKDTIRIEMRVGKSLFKEEKNL